MTDACIVLLWRFGWGHSWFVSLRVGAVLFALTLAGAVYAWWLDRHPDAEQRMLARNEGKRARKNERLAREAYAAEAARRASGRN